MSIKTNDPNSIVIPHLKNKDRAFGGGPTQTGSYKAAEEAAIIHVVIEEIIKEKTLQEYWVEFKREEEAEAATLAERPVAGLVEKEEKKQDAIEVKLTPEEEDELKRLLEIQKEKLERIQRKYSKAMEGYKNLFAFNVSKYGYTDNQAQDFANHIEKVVIKEMRAPEPLFVRRANGQPYRVEEKYQQQSDQTSLSTVLQLRKFMINKQIAVTIEYLKEQKALQEQARAIEMRRDAEEKAQLAEAKEKLSASEYQELLGQATEVHDENGVRVAEATLVNPPPVMAEAKILDIEENPNSELNIQEIYATEYGAAPTPQFTQCAKSYIEDELVPAIETCCEEVNEAVVNTVNEFSPGLYKAFAQSIQPSAPPEPELEPSAPPEPDNQESVWKAPVPRPPLGYAKPKDN